MPVTKIKNEQMKIKVCGVKYNVGEIAALEPDYLGFIFYENSPRNFTELMPEIPENIKKIGVFVNEKIELIIQIINQYQLQIVQLHGDETNKICAELKSKLPQIEVWKSFSVGNNFEFSSLGNYGSADKFLFDTKGENYGGNGTKFNWEILKNYQLERRMILSGGISIEDLPEIRKLKLELPQLEIVDINSRFETKPGLKNPESVKEFIQKIKDIK